MPHLKYFTYILYSSIRNSFYIGHTKNIRNRIEYHNNGYNKSTKSGIPWILVHEEKFNTRSDAMKREMEIKSKKSKKYIEWLINKYIAGNVPMNIEKVVGSPPDCRAGIPSGSTL